MCVCVCVCVVRRVYHDQYQYPLLVPGLPFDRVASSTYIHTYIGIGTSRHGNSAWPGAWEPGSLPRNLYVPTYIHKVLCLY